MRVGFGCVEGACQAARVRPSMRQSRAVIPNPALVPSGLDPVRHRHGKDISDSKRFPQQSFRTRRAGSGSVRASALNDVGRCPGEWPSARPTRRDVSDGLAKLPGVSAVAGFEAIKRTGPSKTVAARRVCMVSGPGSNPAQERVWQDMLITPSTELRRGTHVQA